MTDEDEEDDIYPRKTPLPRIPHTPVDSASAGTAPGSTRLPPAQPPPRVTPRGVSHAFDRVRVMAWPPLFGVATLFVLVC